MKNAIQCRVTSDLEPSQPHLCLTPSRAFQRGSSHGMEARRRHSQVHHLCRHTHTHTRLEEPQGWRIEQNRLEQNRIEPFIVDFCIQKHNRFFHLQLWHMSHFFLFLHLTFKTGNENQAISNCGYKLTPKHQLCRGFTVVVCACFHVLCMESFANGQRYPVHLDNPNKDESFPRVTADDGFGAL